MSENVIFRLLEWPPLYRLAQAVLAPGADAQLRGELRRVNTCMPSADLVLDIGCGPTSWLPRIGIHPIGLDISFAYTTALAAGGLQAITASATDLPFADQSLDSVWSIGMLHHLTDEMARNAISEMVRVTRSGGSIVIFDGVIPKVTARPLIWLLRKIDRGRFMRSQLRLEALLDSGVNWSCRRFTYSYIGHEGVFCTAVRQAPAAALH